MKTKRISKRVAAAFMVCSLACAASSACIMEAKAKSEGIYFLREARDVKLSGKEVRHYSLNPRYEGSDKIVRSASWHSSNPAVATITQSGYLTVKRGGRAVITVKKDHASAKYYLNAHRMALKKSSVSLKKGKKLTVSPVLENDRIRSVKSDDPSVRVQRTAGGKAIRLTGRKKGSATVVITSENDITQRLVVKVKKKK